MQKNDFWLLPQGIEDVLPNDSKQLESLRRQLLDVFACWGYELVIPPVVDFLDSLLTGLGHDLDLQTFKFTDQISGKMLGIRSDITPQVARIDAHNLNNTRPTRLCYVGTILRALEKTRSPMQIGAEIYGHKGIESDLEVIQLMLEMLSISGIQGVHLDLGHVGLYRELAKQAGLSQQQETELFEILQRKAKTELDELIDGYDIDEKFKTIFTALPRLNGDRTVLDKAAALLANTNDSILFAIKELQLVAEKLTLHFPALPISFDLSELRGYHYHTGMVFAAFIPGVGREIARGGRYDNIGGSFGRERAATGFSADLKFLSSLCNITDEDANEQIIYAPFVEEYSLSETVRDLRAKGITVIQQLPGHPKELEELSCNSILEKENNNWVVKPIG